MSKMSLAYQRHYHKTASGKFCACGNPAVKYIGGSWSCRRCLDLDPYVTALHREDEARRRAESAVYDEDKEKAWAEYRRLWRWLRTWRPGTMRSARAASVEKTYDQPYW